MAKLTIQAMQKRFHENRAERAAIMAKSGPLREKRDKMEKEHRIKIDRLNNQIKEAEKGLFEIENEAGALVRALGGKTGKPPA